MTKKRRCIASDWGPTIITELCNDDTTNHSAMTNSNNNNNSSSLKGDKDTASGRLHRKCIGGNLSDWMDWSIVCLGTEIHIIIVVVGKTHRSPHHKVALCQNDAHSRTHFPFTKRARSRGSGWLLGRSIGKEGKHSSRWHLNESVAAALTNGNRKSHSVSFKTDHRCWFADALKWIQNEWIFPDSFFRQRRRRRAPKK